MRESLEERVERLERALTKLGHSAGEQLARNAIEDAIRKLKEKIKRARPKNVHSLEDLKNIVERRKAAKYTDNDSEKWNGRGNYGITQI